MRHIRKHIIHCSDSSFGDVNIIRLWHQHRGFKDVGYHFVIRGDGTIEVGRPLTEIGAHCKGQNMDSIGTCLIGRDKFSDAQMVSLQTLHKMLKKIFPEVQPYAHNFFNAKKSCPNFKVEGILK